MTFKSFFHTLSHLRLTAGCVGVATLLMMGMASCTEKDDTWNPYYNWEGRNALWFANAADTARAEIAKAKAQYGNDWQQHCQWRMFRSLQRSANAPGVLTDSIVCKIATAGTGTVTPAYNDSIRMHFRGWTMQTEYLSMDNVNKEERMAIFTQTYTGNFDPRVAVPVSAQVSSHIEGFQTALQYMVEGDDWYVYIPQQLAYGSKEQVSIPAYSTLLFRINVVGVYESGSNVPDWK